MLFCRAAVDTVSLHSQAAFSCCTYLNTALVEMALFLLLFCGGLDFIQASGSGIIAMQMFFTVNSRSDVGGVGGGKREQRAGGGGRCVCKRRNYVREAAPLCKRIVTCEHCRVTLCIIILLL